MSAHLARCLYLTKARAFGDNGDVLMRPSVYNLRSSAATLGHDDSWAVGASSPACWKWGSAHWDLHGARRPTSLARELNGNSVSIPRLR